MRSIPTTGINLFQLIYILIREYKDKTGEDPLNLSLGNPDGIPPEAIRALKSKYARDPGYDYHTYAEDKNLNQFAESMVAIHGGIEATSYPHLRVLPIAGIKTASALIPLACGLHLPDKKRRSNFRIVSNLPAYDVIGTWGGNYLAAQRTVWPLVSSDNMRLNVTRLKEALQREGTDRADLIFTIRPGNPAAVGASAADWKELIGFCLEKNIRLVNDGAYSGLTQGQAHVPLAQIAKDYPDLEWMELYSVSKSYNDPGARLGAIVGSKDFVEDYTLVKGNTDSGPVPGVMAAYGEFFADRVRAQQELRNIRELYEKRTAYLIPRFKSAGLQPACTTEAGFFTLWRVPESIFGKTLPTEGRHETFNRLVISETGIVGVHFSGFTADHQPEPLIRYAVCADVLDKKFQTRFEERLARLKPIYS